MIIKALLLVALGGAALLSLRSTSQTAGPALRRIAVVLLLIAGALSVLFPSLVTLVANALGVGRGSDLVLYTYVVVSLFAWIGMHRRIHELENKLVVLARTAALANRAAPRLGMPRNPDPLRAATDADTQSQ